MSLIPLRLLRSFGFPSAFEPFWLRNHFSPIDEIRILSKLPELLTEEERLSQDMGTSITKDGFKASLNVRNFQPEEIKVKTIDNTVVIEGKHEEREDDRGYISREFVRKFILPKNYDPKKVTTTLSSEGILTVKAPAPTKDIEGEREHVIPIQRIESNNKVEDK